MQNVGQFKNRYPNDIWEEIIGNCDTRIGMGITDDLTAKYFCSLIGISTVESTSIKKSNSIEGDIEEYGQKNISTLKRNLLNPDEILRLPSMKLLVNLRGNQPLLLDKIIYKQHPLFEKLKDNPISEYNPRWVKNINTQTIVKKVTSPEPEKKKEKLGWHNF